MMEYQYGGAQFAPMLFKQYVHGGALKGASKGSVANHRQNNYIANQAQSGAGILSGLKSIGSAVVSSGIKHGKAAGGKILQSIMDEATGFTNDTTEEMQRRMPQRQPRYEYMYRYPSGPVPVDYQNYQYEEAQPVRRPNKRKNPQTQRGKGRKKRRT